MNYILSNYLKKNFEDIGNVMVKTINRIDEIRKKNIQIGDGAEELRSSA